MKLSIVAAVIAAACLAGCVNTSTMQLAQDTILVSSEAAPLCGRSGAQRVALERASIETLRRGFDRFIVLQTQSGSTTRMVGSTPITASTFGNTTTFRGGSPIFATSREQDIVVQMFREGAPGSANSLSAREILGPEWEQVVARGNPLTC